MGEVKPSYNLNMCGSPGCSVINTKNSFRLTVQKERLHPSLKGIIENIGGINNPPSPGRKEAKKMPKKTLFFGAFFGLFLLTDLFSPFARVVYAWVGFTIFLECLTIWKGWWTYVATKWVTSWKRNFITTKWLRGKFESNIIQWPL